MIEWIIGALVGAWVLKEDKKKEAPAREEIEDIPEAHTGRLLNGYGYTRDNEDLQDLV